MQHMQKKCKLCNQYFDDKKMKTQSKCRSCRYTEKKQKIEQYAKNKYEKEKEKIRQKIIAEKTTKINKAKKEARRRHSSTPNRSLSRHRERAARQFQLYIRLRDSDSAGVGQCCTCNKKIHYKKANAWHYISRRHNATLLDERNVHYQCAKCNAFEGGRKIEHRAHIVRIYGEKTAQELERLQHKIVEYTRQEYDEIYKKYKAKTEKIQKEQKK